MDTAVVPGIRQEKIAMQKEQAERFVVVAGIDFSDTSRDALYRAFKLANREANSEVHVTWILSKSGPGVAGEALAMPVDVPFEESATKLRDFVQAELESFASNHECHIQRTRVHLRLGAAAEEIAQLAADLDADLVVVGTHGRRGVRRFLLGSVAEGTVRLAHCPVLVVRPKDHAAGAAPVPSIAPPCPDCVKAREASDGAQLWCEEHDHKHGPRHTYHGTEGHSRGSRPPMVY
jgi:nucleotide-binding universal stress UspA family protein